MRDYAIVRDELWSLRRLGNTIVMGVIAAVAVGISAIAALQNRADPTILPTTLFGSGLTLGLVALVLIGIDSSFKTIEYLSLEQARNIRDQLRSVTSLPVADAVLGLQPLALEIARDAPRAVWLASFGAWAFVRFIVPGLGLAAVVGGLLSSSVWTAAMLGLLVADVVVAVVVAYLWRLGLQVPIVLRSWKLARDPTTTRER